MLFHASDLPVAGQPEIRMLAGRIPSCVHEYQKRPLLSKRRFRRQSVFGPERSRKSAENPVWNTSCSSRRPSMIGTDCCCIRSIVRRWSATDACHPAVEVNLAAGEPSFGVVEHLRCEPSHENPVVRRCCTVENVTCNRAKAGAPLRGPRRRSDEDRAAGDSRLRAVPQTPAGPPNHTGAAPAAW